MMAELSPFAMVHTCDQWRRAAYSDAALITTGPNQGYVQLAWDDDLAGDQEYDDLPSAGGLAVDAWCRLYRVIPERGQIERSRWSGNGYNTSETLNLFAPPPEPGEDFTTVSDHATDGPLLNPVDVASDGKNHLFIAEAGRRQVVIYDLMQNRVIRRHQFRSAPRKLASDGDTIWLLLGGDQAQLAILKGLADPVYVDLPAEIAQPAALVANNGQVFVLDQAGTEAASVVPLHAPHDRFGTEFGGDLLISDGHILVVARRPGETFLRFDLAGGAQFELPYLEARGYDGRGIDIAPDGHIVYWSASGARRATLARVRYRGYGRVASFQLDSGDYQMQWGRLFVDACIPRGTRISVRCLTLDEMPPAAPALERTLPQNLIGADIERPDLAPMPPALYIEKLDQVQSLFKRPDGNELPWTKALDETDFQTYEAPIIAPPGRYLWVVVELHGAARLTPKVKSLRAEYPSHDLLRRLPAMYSRESVRADFLRRYLAISEGQLRDLEQRSALRHLLINASATPAEMLPWLGSLLGLATDKRWSERATRELVASAFWLFRFRGTVKGLKRFIEIYLDRSIVIIEHFKMRGLGGALLGDSDVLNANSVLGAGFRIGGKLGSDDVESINDIDIEDAITTHAHRFSLIIPADLDDEQRGVIEHLLETHRPAHTLFDICSVDHGMRVGLGLHAGLTSLVGQTSGFGELQIGTSVLGRRDTLGKPAIGYDIGRDSLGQDTRLGR